MQCGASAIAVLFIATCTAMHRPSHRSAFSPPLLHPGMTYGLTEQWQCLAGAWVKESRCLSSVTRSEEQLKGNNTL